MKVRIFMVVTALTLSLVASHAMGQVSTYSFINRDTGGKVYIPQSKVTTNATGLVGRNDIFNGGNGGAIYIPPVQSSDAPKECTPEFVEDEVKGDGNGEVLVDCNLTLEPGDVITKKIVLEGDDASGVTLDCNFATIDGQSCSGRKCDRLEVRSWRFTGSDGDPAWEPPVDVTIKNCNILGAVRIWGMARNNEGEFLITPSREPGYVSKVRNNAPRRITLDNLIITALGERTPLYLAPGVTHTKLVNSEIKGEAVSVAIYLDAESYGNTIRNNYIHTVNPREVMAIDGSSYNKIINNHFSALNNGRGRRNCQAFYS